MLNFSLLQKGSYFNNDDTAVFLLFILQKYFDIFQVLLCEAFLCVFDKINSPYLYLLVLLVLVIFILVFFNLLIRIFFIIIRRNFYIIKNILRNLFSFNNILTFFSKYLRMRIFMCSKKELIKITDKQINFFGISLL